MRAVLLTLSILLAAQGCPSEQPQKPTQQKCAEDDPCWDCHDNGNKKCGPGAGVVLAVRRL